MIKKLAAAALIAASFAGVSAQETLYLVKGNEVVAKYSVDDVDYACFTLPAGVTDNTGSTTIEWKSATANYYGTENDSYSVFQLRLSNTDVWDESFPQRQLYLQFTGPAADYRDLHLFEGTYSLGNADNPEPYKYYPGVYQSTPMGEGVAGCFIMDLNGPDDYQATLITSGSFDIKLNDNIYTISGLMKDENDKVVEFVYEGRILISNQSSEKDPAEELPIPASSLTGDVDFTALPSDSYYVLYDNGSMFADNPNLDYIGLWLYGDVNYASLLEVALVVDRRKYPDVTLPKGKYPIVKREGDNYLTVQLGAVPAFKVKGEANIASYGCWISEDYVESPLVAGEVEVLEDTDLKTVNVKVTLYDNADPAHKVTCNYNGKLTRL